MLFFWQVVEEGNRHPSYLRFGTAGVRAPMGIGWDKLNDITVMEVAQSLLLFLDQDSNQTVVVNKAGASSPFRAVVGHDHRAMPEHNLCSARFGRICSAVLERLRVKDDGRNEVLFLHGPMPTPLVPFIVSRLELDIGICVTASHNPKEDNGIKVYLSNACQIGEAEASQVEVYLQRPEALQLAETAVYVWDKLKHTPTANHWQSSLINMYFRDMQNMLHFNHADLNRSSDLRIIYSAMHGVGHAFAKRAFETFSLPAFISVREQEDPDPNFTTLKSPNPEDKACFERAKKLAETHWEDTRFHTLLLANDPDADRLAVAERQPCGEWHHFSGNEIGLLLSLWMWEKHLERCPDVPRNKVAFVNTVVSSAMMQAVADAEGFHFVQTLTGFKWMGAMSKQLQNQGYTVLLAFEEAIGYGFTQMFPDKDGIAAAAVFAELAVELNSKGLGIHRPNPEPNPNLNLNLTLTVSPTFCSIQHK
jgi:phosphoglucomutase/phosphopentomutase